MSTQLTNNLKSVYYQCDKIFYCPAVYNVFTYDALNTNDSWEGKSIAMLARQGFTSFRSSDRRCCFDIWDCHSIQASPGTTTF